MFYGLFRTIDLLYSNGHDALEWLLLLPIYIIISSSIGNFVFKFRIHTN